MVWVSDVKSNEYQSLHDVFVQMVDLTYIFLMEKECVFRMLHFNSRLHSELLTSDQVVNRDVVY